MIELQDLSCQFGESRAVDRINLTINTGELCVLVGRSGCGKSTTLRLINRLIPRSSGQIRIDDQDVEQFDARQLRLGMGYAIQGTGLFPHWTVARNIAMVPRLLGWSRQRIDTRIRELLELFDLDPATAARYPHQLSGGQAQRVGVARSLAADPPILLMDEPFGALDAITREALQNEMLRIQSTLRKTVVFVTHDIDEALKLGDRIAVMDQGQILQHDTPSTLLREPASEFVDRLFGTGDRGLKLASLYPVSTVMTPTKDAVSTSMTTIPHDESVRQALSLMVWHDTHALTVMDDRREPIGVVRWDQLAGGDRNA
ncbi:osmoprotectant transport system ATP-binding protein [Tamilnaduibacter salinus]|uniref:ABC transporter n=1 Tax=Tamilnaduibacter salinus TaxID=1484056 RepID=A0A2A2I1R8_9GAMM|nr:ABC transporter ATP-binding protein [Tamilnaduibacter salinus]PAV24943.1 ABC transporter [Tamilnaduibacter salinus]PVY76817.1 osmoprotectant transport system ATP-binding protein [Tamilnaduibacter salinus]